MASLIAGTNRTLLPRACFALKDSHWSSVHSLLIYWRETIGVRSFTYWTMNVLASKLID